MQSTAITAYVHQCKCITVHNCHIQHNTEKNSSDNLPSEPPDEYHHSDAVCWREGGITSVNGLPTVTRQCLFCIDVYQGLRWPETGPCAAPEDFKMLPLLVAHNESLALI